MGSRYKVRYRKNHVDHMDVTMMFDSYSEALEDFNRIRDLHDLKFVAMDDMHERKNLFHYAPSLATALQPRV